MCSWKKLFLKVKYIRNENFKSDLRMRISFSEVAGYWLTSLLKIDSFTSIFHDFHYLVLVASVFVNLLINNTLKKHLIMDLTLTGG